LPSRLSHTQRRLLEGWLHQPDRPGLSGLRLDGLRGIQDLHVEFRYPIVAIAGKNGVGKSTILHTAACAYHQDISPTTFVPPRKNPDAPYYTFGDFFVGSRKDGYFLGSSIEWFYFGEADDSIPVNRSNKRRWMHHYDIRPRRPVAYLGLDRLLQAIDLRVLRSHFGGQTKVVFRPFGPEQVTMVNRLCGIGYSEGGRADSKNYHIFSLERDVPYSSFHMGAGEEVACEIVEVLSHLPEGSLLIIEEIEAGLHPEMQLNLMKQLCEEALRRKIQVITSTHSPFVIESLPPEGRILLEENHQGIHSVEYGVGSQYVMGLLAGQPIMEISVYTEDDVSRRFVEEALSTDARRRVLIRPLNGKESVLSQLAAHRHNERLGDAIAVLDGDVSNDEMATMFRTRLGRTLSEADAAWLAERTYRLPGGCPPEKYLWDQLEVPEVADIVASTSNFTRDDISAFCSRPRPADYHDVPYLLSSHFNMDKQTVLTKVITGILTAKELEFRDLDTLVRERLNDLA